MKVYIIKIIRYDDNIDNPEEQMILNIYIDFEKLKKEVIENFIFLLFDAEPNEEELKKIENVKNNNENVKDMRMLLASERLECEFDILENEFDFINEDNLEEVKRFRRFCE